MAQPKFTISLLGFDQRSAEFLSQETRKTMSIVDPISPTETQVVVVDIDEPNSIATWEEFRDQWPHMPAVVAASEEPEIEDASFAEKPFTVETLIDSITEAIIMAPSAAESPAAVAESPKEQEAHETEPAQTVTGVRPADAEIIDTEIIEAASIDTPSDTLEDVSPESVNVDIQPAGEAPASVTAPDEQLPSLSQVAGGLAGNPFNRSASFNRELDTDNPESNFFDPDTYMIGLVLKGISNGEKSGNVAKLRCLLDRTIYIDARNKRVRSNLRDIHMRQISIAPLGEGEHGLDTKLEMIDAKSFEELSDLDGALYQLETFLWELAILTSKGRVPAGTPLDKPVYLMQWPNFTRLMNIPNDMKVSAYWLRLPSSLIDLSDNLNVPMQDVQLLYSAASLTGLAGIARRKSDHLLKPGKPEEHRNRGLFGSIMDRLGKS